MGISSASFQPNPSIYPSRVARNGIPDREGTIQIRKFLDSLCYSARAKRSYRVRVELFFKKYSGALIAIWDEITFMVNESRYWERGDIDRDAFMCHCVGQLYDKRNSHPWETKCQRPIDNANLHSFEYFIIQYRCLVLHFSMGYCRWSS